MACDGLRRALVAHNKKGTLIAAICAAPMVLGESGILEGRDVTCYPGCENILKGANCKNDLVVEDGNIITGKGPGASFNFAFAIASRFVNEKLVESTRFGMIMM